MGAAKALDKERSFWFHIENQASKSIKRGLKHVKQGKVVSHEDVMKKYKKWL